MNPKTAIARSGTSQKDRVIAALASDFVSIEERSIEQQLEFAKKLADHICYYDENNQPIGDWSRFLGTDIEEIITYMDDPESFAVNPDADFNTQRQQRQRLSVLNQPHLVLFLAFLEMTRYIRTRFNELTEKHLNFYYQDVLKIEKNLGAFDKVHVLFELASGVSETRISAGTLLDGGTDTEGNPLHYAIDESFTINRAKIDGIKTLRLQRKYLSLNDLRRSRVDGDEYMLRWALGQNYQGDTLPPYPEGKESDKPVNLKLREADDNSDDCVFLLEEYQKYKDRDQSTIDDQDAEEATAYDNTDYKNYVNYAENVLGFVNLEQFEYCMKIYKHAIDEREEEPSEKEWVASAVNLDNAFNKRWLTKRMHSVIKIYRDDTPGQLEPLFKNLFGDPEPGGPLPPMPSIEDTLISLYDALNPDDPSYKEDEVHALAARYVSRFLYLSKQDYLDIVGLHIAHSTEISNQSYRQILENPEWHQFFAKLVRAENLMRGFKPPESGQWDVQNIYANPEVELSDTKPLPAFGKLHNTFNHDDYFQPGLAVVSPNLHLEGGERKLTIDIACKAQDFPLESLKFIKKNGQLHFDVFFSGEKEWLRLDSLNNPEEVKFDIEWPDPDAKNTYPNIRFELCLNSDHPAIEPLGADLAVPGFNPTEPAIRIEVKNIDGVYNGTDIITTPYKWLSDIRIDKVNIEIKVEAVEDLKISNDRNVLDADAPFKPFGYEPMRGSAFYFSHPELSRKKLKSLDITWEWANLPADLSKHYEAYKKSGVIDIELNNDSFEVDLSVRNKRSWLSLEKHKTLFATDTDEDGIKRTHMECTEGFDQQVYGFIKANAASEDDDPREQKRYFRFKLRDPDFQHKAYPHVVRQLALDEETSKDIVYEPYVPEVTRFSVGYTVTEEIDPNTNKTNDFSFLAHIHPFGAIDLVHSVDDDDESTKSDEAPIEGAFMLPRIQDEGVLYLGFTDAIPGDELSFLVQAIAGSGVQSSEPQNLSWYYRTLEGWEQLHADDLLDDTTRSMTIPGLIRIRLPKDATDTGPLMPSGQHWIAAHTSDAAAGAEILALKTQVGYAVLQNKASNSSHKRLAASTIKSLVEPNAAVTSLTQPYSSFGGYGIESNTLYYQRVSERLRHKDRTLTAWDYEHIVLNAFPDIAHVKCLNQGEMVGINEPGVMEVLVIPDLNNVKPYLPLRPSVPQNRLEAITAMLNRHTPLASKFKVKNPILEPVRCRIEIGFKEGYGHGVHTAKASEDIKAFLSPWVEEPEHPVFGEKFYISSLIYFLETQEYIDYVGQVKVFKEEVYNKGTDDERIGWNQVYGNLIRVDRPDSILVSHDSHVIDIMDDKHSGYIEPKRQGIGYMIIGLDNIVFGDTDDSGSYNIQSKGVNYMMLGLDNIVYGKGLNNPANNIASGYGETFDGGYADIHSTTTVGEMIIGLDHQVYGEAFNSGYSNDANNPYGTVGYTIIDFDHVVH